jgi:hypothetical protein
MTEPMASEPAEPTTRQRLIEKAHDALRTVAYDWSEPTTTDRGRIIAALAEAGLLADPAQTTELEKLAADHDLALWLHAEQSWLHGQALAIAHGNALGWEKRQVRIDAASLIATRAIDEGLPADEALRLIARTLEGKTARALSGEALRAVEERDDAAGDLP